MGYDELQVVLRAIERNGLRWQRCECGRWVEAVRSAGSYRVGDTFTRYELDTLPRMAPRLAEIAPAIAMAVGGGDVAIDEHDGRVFLTVSHTERPKKLP